MYSVVKEKELATGEKVTKVSNYYELSDARIVARIEARQLMDPERTFDGLYYVGFAEEEAFHIYVVESGLTQLQVLYSL